MAREFTGILHYLCSVYPRWTLPWSVISWNAPRWPCVEERVRLLTISGKLCVPKIHVVNSVLHRFWQGTPLTTTCPDRKHYSVQHWHFLIGLSNLQLCASLSFSSPFHFCGITFAFSIEKHTRTHLCHVQKVTFLHSDRGLCGWRCSCPGSQWRSPIPDCKSSNRPVGAWGTLPVVVQRGKAPCLRPTWHLGHSWRLPSSYLVPFQCHIFPMRMPNCVLAMD